MMKERITLILGAMMISAMLASCGTNTQVNAPAAVTEGAEETAPEMGPEPEISLEAGIVAQIEEVDGTKLIIKTGELTEAGEFEATGTLMEIRTDDDTSIRYGGRGFGRNRHRRGESLPEGETLPEGENLPEGETFPERESRWAKGERPERGSRPEGESRPDRDSRLEDGSRKGRYDRDGSDTQMTVSAGDIVTILMKDDTTAAQIRILIRADGEEDVTEAVEEAVNAV